LSALLNLKRSRLSAPINLRRPRVVGSNQPEETKVVGSNQPEEIKVVGSNQPEEIKVVGSTQPKETKVVGSTQPKEIKVVGSTQPKEIKVVGSNQPKEINIVGSTQPKEANAVGSNQPKEAFLKSQLPERIEIISSQFNRFIEGKDNDLGANSEYPPLVRGLLSDTYCENEIQKLYEDCLISCWINGVGYYDKIGTWYEPSYKELIRLFGVGILAKSNPDDPGCGRKAAYAEWLLERHGISARIIVAPKFFGNYGHSWVEVPTSFDRSYYIDLSKGIDYIRSEEEYNPRKYNGEVKENYFIFDDIKQAIKVCETKKFAWWTTVWGKEVFRCKKSNGQ
jgi:hypothetical protein